MVGIGFELCKMFKCDSLFGLLCVYIYVGIISFGLWIFFIVGILLIGILSLLFVVFGLFIMQFQVLVIYLIVVSLILIGLLQFVFMCFMFDCLFEKCDDLILFNYYVVLFVMMLVVGGLGLFVIVFVFLQQLVIYWLLMLVGFVVMVNIWIVVIFLLGMKQYKVIVWIFLVGYMFIVLLVLLFNWYGLEGLLLGFVMGQFFLLIGMVVFIYCNFSGWCFLLFEVFDRWFVYLLFMFIGLFYNFGIWFDKFMFWYVLGMGQQVIGLLYVLVIYDILVFLVYFGIIFGMVVFLVCIEIDFVEYYDVFYDVVWGGVLFEYIEDMCNMMVQIICVGLYEIVKI